MSRILELNPSDFEKIKPIILESKLIEDNFFETDDAVSFIKHKLDQNNVKIFITKIDNQIIGFALLFLKLNPLSLIKFNWHISYLYVKPDFRRQNIGKKIMYKCIEYARFAKVQSITLNTNKENIIAQNLYEQLGFKRANFISNYYYYELKFY